MNIGPRDIFEIFACPDDLVAVIRKLDENHFSFLLKWGQPETSFASPTFATTADVAAEGLRSFLNAVLQAGRHELESESFRGKYLKVRMGDRPPLSEEKIEEIITRLKNTEPLMKDSGTLAS